jgi:hypothetical protein
MKVIWNNNYTTIEWEFMKISFVIFWLNAIITIFIEDNFIPMPIGVLSFLQPNSSISVSLKLVCLILIMIAIYFYISEKQMIWVTSFLFITSVLVFSIEESNGIFRRNDLFSFIFFSQFFSYVFKAKNIDSNIEKNRVQFSVQVIAVGYTLSAISKLNASGLNWVFDGRKMPLQIMKSFFYSYVNDGNNFFIQKGNEMIKTFNNNLYLVYFLLGFSLFLEFFAVVSIFNKKISFIYGLLLLVMHIGIFWVLDVAIKGIYIPMLIFMVNPLFLFWIILKKIKDACMMVIGNRGE